LAAGGTSRVAAKSPIHQVDAAFDKLGRALRVEFASRNSRSGVLLWLRPPGRIPISQLGDPVVRAVWYTDAADARS
jgi:hypothetical protein